MLPKDKCLTSKGLTHRMPPLGQQGSPDIGLNGETTIVSLTSMDFNEESDI